MFAYFKCYISTELKFLKKLMLMKHAYQKSVMFAIIGIYQIKVLSLNQMSAIMLLFITDVCKP